MNIKEKIVEYLDELADKSILKDVYVIEYKGKRLVMGSNKSSWKTLSAAKNALRYDIPRRLLYDLPLEEARRKLETLKELEDKEIIKYIKL